MRVNGTYLIIDDKPEDGEPISKALRNRCIPHLFFLADVAELHTKSEEGLLPIERVKVVFQDINLTGATTPSKQDYDTAASFLEKILPPDNGPWLMVVWSTWSDDEGTTNYPQELFEHLVSELPDGQKPLAMKVIDKHYFTVGGAGTHNSVVAFEEMNDDKRSDLLTEISDKVDLPVPLSTLLEWELSASNAVNETLIEIQTLANRCNDAGDGVGKLLYELAKAEAGKSISDETCSSALSRILNSQLISRIPLSIESGSQLSRFDDVELENLDEWKRRINKFLHFENEYHSSGPGSLYSYQSLLNSIASYHYVSPASESGSVRHKNEIVGEHIIKNSFISSLSPIKAKYEESVREIISSSECVVVDVTPPCDYAQNKAEWIKLNAGILIDATDKANELKWMLDALKKPSFIWTSCHFSDKSDNQQSTKLVIFNSRITFTIPEHEIPRQGLQKASIFKLKEQILRDLSHWLSSQASRPGYTYM